MSRLTRKERHKTNFLKARQIEKIPVREPILIVCEDGKSSVYYFQEKVVDLRLESSKIKITGESDPHPSNVVEFARIERAQNRKRCRVSGEVPYKHIYCVMDVDDHVGLSDAVQRARDLNFIPIVSNESFELWYLLHFIDNKPGSMHRDDINRLLSTFLNKRYDKGARGMYPMIKSNEEKAIALADKLLNDAVELCEERNPYRNPSTEVHLLVKYLNQIAGGK